MDVIEIERLLSDKLSNILHTSGADGGQTLSFAGWHASPNGNVVVNVRLSSEDGTSYRCRISSTEGGYYAEGPVTDTPATAIDGTPWNDIEGWMPFQNSD